MKSAPAARISSRSGWHRAVLPLCMSVVLPSLLVAGFAAQLVFAVTMPWSRALLVSLHHWLVPFLVVLLGWAVAQFFPVDRGRVGLALLAHLVAAALVITFAGRVETVVFPPSHRLHVEGASVEELAAMHGAPPREQRNFLAVLVSSRWQLHLAALAVSISLTHAWHLHRRVQERDRRAIELTASLSRAKLQALRLQLQPHFLFNTLNTISNLIRRDADAADEMISNLSELLRLSLDVNEQEVPLRREFEILDCYLNIEQSRFGHRLRVVRHIDEAVFDCLVPALMLQPIVENAVRHGLEPRAAPGTITIRAERVADQLRLVVSDDGCGLRPLDTRSEHRGIGLANTEARLRELHGDAAQIVLREPQEGGVSVELKLPFRHS